MSYSTLTRSLKNGLQKEFNNNSRTIHNITVTKSYLTPALSPSLTRYGWSPLEQLASPGA